jgi:hypothetical protein
VHYGTLLFFSRQYDRAAAQLAKTLDLYPDNAAAHQLFGDVCANRNLQHEAITQWCAALNLNGRSEDARVLEQTFKTAGFDAAVRTLGERQLEELDARRARGEYVAAAHYVFAHIKRGNLEGRFDIATEKCGKKPDWFALQNTRESDAGSAAQRSALRQDCRLRGAEVAGAHPCSAPFPILYFDLIN